MLQSTFALLLTVIGSSSMFTVFSYISPILEDITKVGTYYITVMLALYGIGLAVGNYIAAKFADRHLYSVLSISMMTTVALLILLSVNMAYSLIVPALIFFWGVTSFSIVPPLQTLVVAEAKDAPNLASSMNIAAFNLGNATGAALGGFVIYLELGLPAVALAGAGTSAMGLVLLHLYRKSKAQGSNNMEECY